MAQFVIPPIEILLSQGCDDPTFISTPLIVSIRKDSADSSSAVTRGAWQLHEDSLLRNAVGQYGIHQWDSVTSEIAGRSSAQCRERWLFRISPGLNKSPFEQWEDDIIIKEREKIGNHWTVIALQLPGRTSCAVKNRWYSVLRKQRRSGERWQSTKFDILHLLSHPVRQRSDLLFCRS
jgi:hypothetical protein